MENSTTAPDATPPTWRADHARGRHRIGPGVLANGCPLCRSGHTVDRTELGQGAYLLVTDSPTSGSVELTVHLDGPDFRALHDLSVSKPYGSERERSQPEPAEIRWRSGRGGRQSAGYFEQALARARRIAQDLNAEVAAAITERAQAEVSALTSPTAQGLIDARGALVRRMVAEQSAWQERCEG
jgi:hypothetical protein